MMEIAIASAFPHELASEARAAASALNISSDYDHRRFSVDVAGETLHIPCRVPSPSSRPDLSELRLRPRQVALCILTRSADGFERQMALKEVLLINEAWSIPFVIALVGDYVVEIVDEIYVAAPTLNRRAVATFIRENPGFYRLTCDRVMSYWDCYYRWHSQRSDYVGFKLLRELDALVHAGP